MHDPNLVNAETGFEDLISVQRISLCGVSLERAFCTFRMFPMNSLLTTNTYFLPISFTWVKSWELMWVQWYSSDTVGAPLQRLGWGGTRCKY